MFGSREVFVDESRRGGPSSSSTIPAHGLLFINAEETVMSLVRLLGFRTLSCGCVIGRYRELATSREVSYVEEKGSQCETHGHRRNHTIPERLALVATDVAVSRAS